MDNQWSSQTWETYEERLAFLAEKIDECNREIIHAANDSAVPEHMIDAHEEYIDSLIYELEVMEYEYATLRAHMAKNGI